jgi:hypothetical protein
LRGKGIEVNNKIENELENSENWDFEHAEKKQPTKALRVIVSVAFKKNDFTIISNYAERMDKKVSEFIREAALDKASGRASITVVNAFGSTGSVWCGQNLPSSTQVQTFELERNTGELVSTY